MIMRITWGKVRPGKWGDFEQAITGPVVAKSNGVKGLRGRWLAQDVEDRDAGYTVSLWESDEELEAYMKGPLYQEIVTLVQPFFAGEFRTTHCDVKDAWEVK